MLLTSALFKVKFCTFNNASSGFLSNYFLVCYFLCNFDLILFKKIFVLNDFFHFQKREFRVQFFYEEILVGSLLGDGGGDLCGSVCRRSETVYA